MPRPPKARAAILDAYRDLLVSDGERAATMDAVAAAAGVSKGGLLYHFKSKDALADGLLEWLREAAAEDRARMAAAEEGPSRYFVRTSVSTGSDMDLLFVAAVRLAQAGSAAALAALEELDAAWLDIIRREVPDPAASAAIMLIGEGLYHYSSLAGTWPEAAFGTGVDGLLGVVDRLRDA
ncbi:TetR family transcriptional regulator [Sinomonas cyclohexanicum]|uniref:TetR family transcriptional regulator n=1 Tax=Sinomonas cyclohexanicum TaxID=322009 RepID=A0ABM7PQ63_SINCY|nr:TetR family transcriptional regulator [Corynebacterium cyclohexanicum]BCT74331.1 TetR family transcriptional regulator [Corynebacterium cyclohexanicum]